MSGGTLLRIDRLGVSYPGAATPALQDVSLDLAPGERHALLGATGCGKSTLARAVCGLLPPGASVYGGVAWRDGPLRVDGVPRRQLGRDVAVVFQDAAGALDPVVRVADLLTETVAHLRSVPRRTAAALGAELLAEVGLRPELGERHPHRLSGGEQQRVGLALALAGDPALLVADEPTTSLDPPSRREIAALLDAVARRRGAALLFISHDLDLAAGLCEQVTILDAGRAVETGTTSAVFATPSAPATRRLVDAFAAKGAPEAADRTTAEAPVLDVRDVTVHRDGADAPVLRGLDLALTAGEAFGLVGVSGAGKSTLARALAGLLPAAGKGLPGSVQPGAPHPVQLVFQNPAAALDPRRPVLLSVRDAALAAGGDAPDSEAKAVLESAGLPAALHGRCPGALSGGQQQRAVIARALAARPRLLVADEPAASLDLASRLELVDLLDRSRKERDLALLLISHDLRLVRRTCARTGVLEGGRIIEIVRSDTMPTSATGRRLWAAAEARPDDGHDHP